MPFDALLTPFRTQAVHSKITGIRTSLPLAMNLLWIFHLLNSSSFNPKRRKEGKNKLEFVTCYPLMQDFTTINIGNKIERFLNYISNHSTVFHISILYNTLSLEPQFVFDFHRNLIHRNFILI